MWWTLTNLALNPWGFFYPLSGEPIYYVMCDDCGFCFAPEIALWSLSQFQEKIYNQDYAQVDPEYMQKRPAGNANLLKTLFPQFPHALNHLDYGGGNGHLADMMVAAEWQSVSYDPFEQPDISVSSLGTFALITAFEVFEHVPDPNKLMQTLGALLQTEGLLIFSTLISDGHIVRKQRLNWWYASPRNGHISLFSKKSLSLLAQQHGLQLASFSDGLHLMFKQIPPWGRHLFQRN